MSVPLFKETPFILNKGMDKKMQCKACEGLKTGVYLK